MEIKSYTSGTIDLILKYATIEGEVYDINTMSLTYQTEHPEIKAIRKDMDDRNWDMNFFQSDTVCKNTLKTFFEYIVYNAYDDIIVSQSPLNSYVFKFKFKATGSIYHFPLLRARKLLYFLKTWKCKIEVKKLDRSVTPDLTAYLRDLCFRGKSDLDFPVYAPIADIAKKTKVTVNGWFTPPSDSDFKEEQYVNQASLRFSGAEWFNATQNNVLLIGAGGLGSNIATSLCRLLGDKTLYIYDSDKVEQKNLAGQNFGTSDIGEYKVTVVANQCINFNPVLTVMNNQFNFENFQFFNNLPVATITGLDNMASRINIYYKWKEKVDSMPKDVKPLILIDARLSAETWQIFCVTSDNKKAQDEYENKWLFPDSEADEGVCSYKQTAFAAQMCASYVSNLYVNFCTNRNKEADDLTRRFLPFMTEYEAPQMIMRVQDI